MHSIVDGSPVSRTKGGNDMGEMAPRWKVDVAAGLLPHLSDDGCREEVLTDSAVNRDVVLEEAVSSVGTKRM